MALYHFEIDDDGQREDLIEEDLPSLEAVRKTAIRLSGELLRDDACKYSKSSTWKLSVTAWDAAGTRVFELRAESRD